MMKPLHNSRCFETFVETEIRIGELRFLYHWNCFV